MSAQSGGTLSGRVVDPSGRPIPDAQVLVSNAATLAGRRVKTNSDGLFNVADLPVGKYQLEVKAAGFRTYKVEEIEVDVARTLIHEVRLDLGDISQEITVKAWAALIDGGAISVGHAIDPKTVQELPLNGRHILDLALLIPGSVAPSNGFSTSIIRGLGTLAINTAGNREETVNYMVNGITLNDLVFSNIQFQPAVNTIQEFKVDNSTVSAEFGQTSGAVVNMATRSGTNDFHAELFEFLRNDILDARNFFNFRSGSPPPFKRNQFGVNVGGPIVKGRTFFFLSYEGLRQSQGLDLNSLVLSDAQRKSVVDPVIAKLMGLIPLPNFVDSSGQPRFVGSTHAAVQDDQWALDITHDFSKDSRLHAYYAFDLTNSLEPTLRGNTIPGFGYRQTPQRQFFSLSETQSFGPSLLNETRLGFNRISSRTVPSAPFNPSDFGIRNGVDQALGLPQINVAGGALNFGGPSTLPAGRGDTTIVAANTMSCVCGRHFLKIGGEFRQFLNNNYRQGTGSFDFASIPAFLAADADSFNVTLGSQTSSIAQGALGLFAQTSYKWRPNLTLELGLRYDWNLSPTERYNRFIVFDPASGSLVRVGQDGDKVYAQNNKNFEPRLGFAWDPSGSGNTLVRGAYALMTDQPMTSIVTPTAANPPLAVPIAFSGAIRLDNALDVAQPVGLAPASIDRGFKNAYLQTWNLNIQRALGGNIALMAGYFGSKGTHLILRRNLNQPVDGVRPYAAVAQSSSILPGTPLGNITQVESVGNSSYNALWVSLNKPFAHGLQLSGSYTWSKSIDLNSLSTDGVVVQDSYNLRNDRGLSNFDARHRFVLRAVYEPPFRGNRLKAGWQLAVAIQAQSGNPVNIVTTNSTLTGVGNTVRPGVLGPVTVFENVDRWFDTSAFAAQANFGDFGRNVVIGPGFNNTDVSLMKDMRFGEAVRMQFRVEIFDVFNHANLGQPGNVVDTPNFGRVTSTRFPTGESGSARQLQFGIKLIL